MIHGSIPIIVGFVSISLGFGSPFLLLLLASYAIIVGKFCFNPVGNQLTIF